MQEAAHLHSPQRDLDRLRAALAAAADAVYDWDLVTDRITWFDGADRALGLRVSAEAPTGGAYDRLIRPEDVATRRQKLSRLDALNTTYDCEYRICLPGGNVRWVHDRGHAELSADGNAVRLTGIIRTSMAQRQNHFHDEGGANYDSLTGHFSRGRLREALEHAINFSQRYELGGAYLVVGMDKLTMLNQALGHEIADTILMSIADRIDRALRASDVIGRAGGDRFGLVLSNIPEGEVEAAADKLLEAVRNSPIETAEGPVYVTVSIGAVTFPGAANTALDIMRRADIALQKAKQAGRDCAILYAFSEEQLTHHRECIATAEQVQRALREKRLRFAYQPIVDSRTLEPVYHECLLRMIQPGGEIVPAARFMPVVEDLGMIRSVDRSVLERGVEELSIYPDARIAINVSGLTTSDRAWMRSAVALLRGRPDIAERLAFEITETAGLEDLDACCRFVSTLRDLGCEVALDDFGAGYTSFRHLKKLAVSKVKIDGSFVRKIGENPDNLVFVRTLLDLAHTFNLATVAECVETEEEATLLINEGVHYLQGYAFGKPDMQAPWTPSATARDSRIDAGLSDEMLQPVIDG